MQEPKKIEAVFYRAANGAEPVREWLLALGPEDRRLIGFDMATAEFGWPVGMPLCRSLGGGLWEVRSSLGQGADCPGNFLYCPRPYGPAARLYKEVAEDPKDGTGYGTQAPKGY